MKDTKNNNKHEHDDDYSAIITFEPDAVAAALAHLVGLLPPFSG